MQITITIMFFIMAFIIIIMCFRLQLGRLRYDTNEQKYNDIIQAATKRRTSARIHKQTYFRGTKSE
jgi:hypothetical protein